MKNKYDIVDKIGFSLLSLIVIAFSIIIGANDKTFKVIPTCISLVLIAIFLVIKKIIKKDESIFFKTRIDIFCFAFMLSTMLPLLFKTYSSLSYEIEFVIKYFLYYLIYVLARNVIKTKDDIKEIFRVIIISSFFPIVLGFDQKYFHRLDFICELFDLKYNYDYKMSFTFGYANSVAIFMSSCIFMTIYLFYDNTKKILKGIDAAYILFAIFIIYLTYSRLVFVLLILFIIIFLCFKYKYFIKNNYKKFILVLLVAVFTGILFFQYACKYSKPRYVSDEKFEHVFGYHFKKNEEYKIELNIDFYSNDKISKVYDSSSFNIKIASINEYYNEDVVFNENYGNGHKKISIDIKTLDNTRDLRLYIQNRFKGSYRINNIYINGKEYILNYKYLPSKIGKMVKYLSFSDKSLDQRKTFYKMSLDIFKKHILFGNGGNAWFNMSRAYENYKFFAKETHSYFFELLISFGLVGTVLFLIFVFLLFKNMFKKKNNDEIKIIIYAVGIILLHSLTFDFNMSIMFISIICYVLFACSLYNCEDKINHKSIKYFDYFSWLVILFVILVSIYGFAFETNLIDKSKTYKWPLTNSMVKYNLNHYKNMDSDEQIEYIKYLMDKEPYFYQNKVYNYYFLYIYQNLNKLNTSDIDGYLDYGLDILKSVEPYAPQYIVTIIQRETIIYNLINALKNSKYVNKDKYVEKYSQLFLDEYENNVKIIKNRDRNGYDEYYINQILSSYEKMYDGIR